MGVYSTRILTGDTIPGNTHQYIHPDLQHHDCLTKLQPHICVIATLAAYGSDSWMGKAGWILGSQNTCRSIREEHFVFAQKHSQCALTEVKLLAIERYDGKVFSFFSESDIEYSTTSIAYDDMRRAGGLAYRTVCHFQMSFEDLTSSELSSTLSDYSLEYTLSKAISSIYKRVTLHRTWHTPQRIESKWLAK